MIKTVIFDLDDTLYHEADYCKSGLRSVCRFLKNKYPSCDEKKAFIYMWDQFNSGDRTRIFNNTLKELSLPEDNQFIKELVNFYRKHEPDICIKPETRELLEDLSNGYRLALLSDGFLPAQRLKVDALGIGDLFDISVFTEELGREHWKPSTRGFELILENTGDAPETMVYVGDNEAKDFVGPNKLQMNTIKLEFPGQLHNYKSENSMNKPDHIIQRLAELPDLLKKL